MSQDHLKGKNRFFSQKLKELVEDEESQMVI
jgi:hypothetical protein